MRAALISALACCALEGAAAVQVGHVAQSTHEIVPKLQNVASDKDFFGPPFPADYPDDMSPPPNDLKPKKRAATYPHLAESTAQDKDYVKDENSDSGEWEAQMEYDRSRAKYDKENQLSKTAKERLARREAAEAEAKRNAEAAAAAEAAAKAVEGDAKKEAEANKSVEDHIKNASDKAIEEAKNHAAEIAKKKFSEKEINEEVDEVGKKLEAAEAAYPKQEADFRDCHAKLDKAQQEVAELEKQFKVLKATQAAMEESMEPNAKGDQLDTEVVAAKARHSAAEAEYAAAKAKVDAFETQEKEFSQDYHEEEHEFEEAKATAEKLVKEQAEAKAEYEAARSSLRRFREPIAPATPTTAPLADLVPSMPTWKSGSIVPAMSTLAMVVALCAATLL